ncbi:MULTISPECIES: glycosyltransferase [unclassified Duganella]|uniref:glycosyltransferase n=1 Tax=unclassified Duganella TaxID=2636909 RepID=UPI000E347E17|nr:MULTISPECIES: glycosyltransferase [unclassified Duganella]RFP11906.1 glycosyltransferase [Duganella sp. BJB475]RFP30084.1 glycosyltransferase [Duganella sp. BJB476]
MRLVIDLQSCQNGAARAPDAVLALAQALLRQAATRSTPHTVLLALAAGQSEHIDRLRLAFAGLPPAQLLSYEVPAGHGWSHHAATLVRDGFLASLNPDAVFAPGLFDVALNDTVFGPGPDGVAMVYTEAGAAADKALAERQQAALRGAALVRPAIAAGLDAEAEAAALWLALEQAHAARLAQRAASANTAAARPRLAYISPLPPEKSGIADYSVELIAELEPYYDITLVVAAASAGGVAATALGARLPLLTPEQFDQQAPHFQRLLYHFGNSNAHQYMFPLLERHPGIVVLHDFFLSGVIDNMEREGVQPLAYVRALYASHGHSGLLAHKELGHNPSIWAMPSNKAVLDQAAGVIVHSDFSRTLAEQWYGPGSADTWRTLPLLRGLPPQAAGQTPAELRAAARRQLGIAEHEFLVCSFGMLGPTKLNHRLLDAFLASPLARQIDCRLLFVGENEGGQYGAELARRITGAAHDTPASIAITGFVSTDDYQHYLAASDVAVQLRTQTRGETSASVLDCLLHGVPAIINAHGAAATLPDAVLVKLPDLFEDAQLSAALAELYAQPQRRAQLAEAGRAHVRLHHAPAAVGRQYHGAIEELARDSAAGHYRQLVAAVSAIRPAPDDSQLIGAAASIAANQPGATPRQMLIDISALVQADYKTGIQRVVRSIVLALIKAPPAGYRVEPVYSEGSNRSYRYARSFTAEMLGVRSPQLEDAPIDSRAGDLFLGLDLASNITSQNQPQLLAMRRRGVAVWFVVYDLLPVLRPECFTFAADKYYADYLDTITYAADGIVAISRAVSEELAAWVATRPNRRQAPLKLSHFHLGADLDASAPSTGLPDNAGRVLQALQEAPTLLMVGTLEPRKGQAQALAACELLWAQGVAVNLVIVGKNGWLVEALVRQLEQHPQREQRLFWLPGVSDQMLEQLYQHSAALLAASEGEGFGLPLIEAAQHRLPIIARAIPVFREVAGEHAYYFDGKSPQDLASAIEAWLALHAAGRAPASADMPWLTWQQSAQQLQQALLSDQPHASVGGGGVAPQLLVDVSAVAREDLKTGIQRVVRAQLSELMALHSTRYQVLPVYLSDEGGRWHYRYARRYQHTLTGTDSYGVIEDEVVVAAGDVFYSPDFFPGAVTEAGRIGLFQRWRDAGVSVNFLIHDLLPVLRPEFFPARVDDVFEKWLHTVSNNADRLLCISGAVADETRAWLQQHAPQRPLPQFAVLHHGADIAASLPSTGLADDAAAVLADIAAAPSFLMVGTIEPRKGHLQALDAFEQLWAAGADVRLVVVGGEGWKGLPDGGRRTIPAIMARLRGHPELGRRLHWLQGISDEYLERVYRDCACLLFPSEGEGFGLPLIEAARHDLPLLTRDIPVFREIAGAHAQYFSGDDGAALAAAVREWLRLHAAGQVQPSSGMPWQTWADNARNLTAILFPTPSTQEGPSV